MKAVMAFAQRSAASKAASGAKEGANGWGGKELGGASRGVSILGSISEWAGVRQRAQAMDQEARDERMASRQEFIQASQKVNAIDAEFNALVGQQLAAASGMGIDVGSGSVVAAREAARDDADRERKIIRANADMNASLRRLRAINLNMAAKSARFGANINLAQDIGNAVLSGGMGG